MNRKQKLLKIIIVAILAVVSGILGTLLNVCWHIEEYNFILLGFIPCMALAFIIYG